MERYHTFPGTGDGDDVPALKVNVNNVYGWSMLDRTEPNDVMVMRKNKTGTWVKFDDALKRSRKEYDEGMKAAHESLNSDLLASYNEGVNKGRQYAKTKFESYRDLTEEERQEASKLTETRVQVANDLGYAKGYAKAKDDAVNDLHTQTAAAFDRGLEHAKRSTTNQLLTEVFAERARLELVIENLLTLTGGFVAGLDEDLADGTLSEDEYDTYSLLIGAAEQAELDHGKAE